MSTNIIKNAVVTGGAKRLGREIAIELAKAGWNVAVHYNTSEPDEVLAEIRKFGVKAIAIKGDLVNLADVKNIIPQARKELGEITLLINNASIFEKIMFMESDENAFDTHMDIHVKAPFFLSQAFAVQCHGGQIINIVDTFTNSNKAMHFAYLLSKKSLRNLTQMLAAELAPAIRVNSVLPGPIEEFPSSDDGELRKKKAAMLPSKKLATAAEVTAAILELTENTLTAQEVYVDSGEHLL